MPGSERRRELLGSADDDQGDVFVRRDAMVGENQLRQQVHRSAARRDADDLAFELLDRFDFGLADEIELRLGVDDQDEPHRRAANTGGDDRSGGRCVIHRAADQRLHAHRSAYEKRFEIESFLAIKAFELGDAELQLGDGDGGRRKPNLFELRQSGRGGQGIEKISVEIEQMISA